jgi:hypothetical protein
VIWSVFWRNIAALQPANPLTARVTVNRFWQEVFGTGIVHAQLPLGWRRQPFLVPDVLYEGRWEF